MLTMKRNLLALALLATAAACDGAPTASSAFAEPATTGASFAAASSSLTFSSTQGGSPQAQTASGGAGRIDFAGSLTTPTPCYALSASHTERNTDVTVTVTAADQGGFCTQVLANNNYQGAVTGLAPGAYVFTVIEVVNGTRSIGYTGPVVVQ